MKTLHSLSYTGTNVWFSLVKICLLHEREFARRSDDDPAFPTALPGTALQLSCHAHLCCPIPSFPMCAPHWGFRVFKLKVNSGYGRIAVLWQEEVLFSSTTGSRQKWMFSKNCKNSSKHVAAIHQNTFQPSGASSDRSCVLISNSSSWISVEFFEFFFLKLEISGTSYGRTTTQFKLMLGDKSPPLV